LTFCIDCLFNVKTKSLGSRPVITINEPGDRFFRVTPISIILLAMTIGAEVSKSLVPQWMMIYLSDVDSNI